MTAYFKAMPWAHNLVGLTQTGDRIFKGNALGQAHSIAGLTQIDDWFFKGHTLGACITLLV